MRELQLRCAPRPATPRAAASPAGLAVADHLEEAAQVNGMKGISAGHRPEAFAEALSGRGKIESRFRPTNPISGVETVKYRIEARNAKLQPEGRFSAEHSKTLFDPDCFPRERLGQLADAAFEHAPASRAGYVQFGQDYVYVVHDSKTGRPRTLGFESETFAVDHMKTNSKVKLVKRPAADLASFFDAPSYPSRWSRVAGAVSKGLGALGTVGGGLQAWSGADQLWHAHNGTQVLNGGADLTGGLANTVSGVGVLAGAEAVATRFGAAGAVIDGARDVVLGLTSEKCDLERVSLGSLKTAAGVAMAVPGGALIGGAVYAGAVIYEHREAVGEALNSAWNCVTGWLA